MDTETELEEFELELEVGDRIAFECAALDNSYPRWQFNDDLGESDIWAKGKVTYVDSKIIQTEYTIDKFIGVGKCTWPNFEHEEYDPLQWHQDGYLMLISKQPNCECGAEAVYGPQTGHAGWCPKYE